MFNKCLREPFFHFIAIGALLFFLYEITGADPDPALNTQIRISSADIEELRRQWSKQSGMDVDRDTLKQLIEEKIYQEVMLREAKRIGLHKNDTIIRRRLVQKMEFLSADLSRIQVPDEKALLAYFENNRERYRVPEQRSFTHIYFSRDKRGQDVFTDARALLEKLVIENPAMRQVGQGDNFILQYDYRKRNQQQIARVFGTEFASELFKLEPGSWHGPVLSEYGAHLVRIQQVDTAHVPALTDISTRVMDDFMEEQLAELKKQQYAQMRSRYQIEVTGQLAAGVK